MSARKDGFLVVLSDVKAEDDRDYLAWLTTEHVQERLGIPGFLAVRVFRKPIARGHQYLIWYRLSDADVVDSGEYLKRLNNPTPWSRRIMPVLENFGRGGGEIVASAGGNTGRRIFAVCFNQLPSSPPFNVSDVKALSGICALHLFATDPVKSALRTNERDLRSSDNSFSGLLIAESNNDQDLSAVARSIPAALMSSKTGLVEGLYREIFSLSAHS